MTQGWPARLREGSIELRPLRLRDATAWREVRSRNAAWLRPWEATLPPSEGHASTTYGSMVRRLRAEAREGHSLPFAIVADGCFAGQVTVGGIARGSLLSAYVGYWIDQRYAGRGIMPQRSPWRPIIASARWDCIEWRLTCVLRTQRHSGWWTNSVSERKGCAKTTCTSTVSGVTI